MPDSPHLSRREFVAITAGALGTVMVVAVGLPAVGYLVDPALKIQQEDAWIPLGPLENYPVGQPTLFTFTRSTVNGWVRTSNSYGVYVWRKTENPADIICYNNTCTHLSCRVVWKDASQDYVCPCHDGHFDREGNVTQGPPPAPLNRYEYKVEEDVLFIHLVEG